MKINAKDLCSIKDIQELKSVDSINNILKVINSEITPCLLRHKHMKNCFQ